MALWSIFNSHYTKKLEENKYVKIITNRYTNEEISSYVNDFKEQIIKFQTHKSEEYQKYIFPFLISYHLLKLLGVNELSRGSNISENLLKYQKVIEAIDLINSEEYMNDSRYIDFFNTYLKNGKIFDTLIRTYRQVPSESKRKYLKYKQKYLELKKNYWK